MSPQGNGGVNKSFTRKALELVPSYRTFRNTYQLLQRSQWWSRAQLEEYQLTELRKLLDHAYANVPYYTKVFDERSLKPKDIQDFKDLRLLPYLTKNIIRQNLNYLKAKNYAEDRFEYVTTGGSTGTPLGFYYERGTSRAIEWAFIKAQWDRVGYRFRDKCVVLKGQGQVTSSPSSKKALFGRWMVLPSNQLVKANVNFYLNSLRHFNPTFIQAYPSTITALAKLVDEQQPLHLPKLKSILCGSENLYNVQREILQKRFGCRVFTWYGHSERAILASECEKSNHYHVCPEYGILELMDNNEKPLDERGAKGQIVGTALTNYAMPLIRYVTDDISSISDRKCSCGRDYQILESIDGRLQEYFIGMDGRKISLTMINNIHSDVFNNVLQFQFFQDEIGKVFLNLIRNDHYTSEDTEAIKVEVQKKLGDEISLEICFVDMIPRTQLGKSKVLIQKLPIDEDNG